MTRDPAAGSDLDKNDGFLHSSNGAMVKKVAAMFFKDVGDALLLKAGETMFHATI